MFVLLAIINGGLTVVGRVVNAVLSDRVGSMGGSLINHAVGWGVAGVLLIAGIGTGSLRLAGVPWWQLLGGCFGVLVVAASNYAVRHAGTVLFAVLLLLFQLATSAVIDQWGLLGQASMPVTPLRLLGLALLGAGTVLVVTDRAPTTDRTSTKASAPQE
jgi:transporter family-2 protein